MGEPTFFSAHQRATIEAAMAQIIPADGAPGAREAGAVNFIDLYLSGIEFIYAKPDGSGFETLSGRQAEAWRKRIAKLRETYVSGIAALDELSRKHFQLKFVALSEAQQNETLKTLEENGVHAAGSRGAAGGGPALQQILTETELEFFPLLVLHTRQGFYSDPIYGGNRDRAGWRAIGFPGPASLAAVHNGTFSALPWFAEGEEQKYREANRGV